MESCCGFLEDEIIRLMMMEMVVVGSVKKRLCFEFQDDGEGGGPMVWKEDGGGGCFFQ